jgi:DNA-binding CsgD family transcriptional regulator
MRLSLPELPARHRALVAVTALQAFSGIYFVVDVLGELPELRTEPMHPVMEIVVVAALWFGSILGAIEIARLLRRNRRIEDRLRAASGAFLDMMEDSFARWGLTTSERDVALLSLKGLSVAEIAALRQTRAGTVKAQCAAVYRKAGVGSRSELLGHFVEDLMAGIRFDTPESGPSRPPAGARAAGETMV